MTSETPDATLPVDLEDLTFLGTDLKRPECVLAAANGVLLAADWDGGVTRIAPDGRQERFLTSQKIDGEPLRPNGIALCEDGSFLIAHLGQESGGLFRLDRAGGLTPVLTEIEGAPVPPSNFVLEDAFGRIWLTVSTRRKPRNLGYRADVDDGFIVVIDAAGARIAADGLGYTNEVQIDPSGDWLYVNETFGRRLSRLRLTGDGRLGARETVAEFGAGTFPDGLTFDAEGAIWITSIVSNRVIRVLPDGSQETVLEDSDAGHLAWVEEAYRTDTLGRPHLDRVASQALRNVSSLAFGGPDLRTAYLGCLLGEQIASFRSPVAGRPPFHWDFPA